MTSQPLSSTMVPDRNLVWEHCRNALGIARLLVQEGRAVELVDTACYLAVESACRVAMDHGDLLYDGNPARALGALAAPRGLWPLPQGSGPERLRATERVVGWLATYLKSEAPHHSWGL